MTDFLYDWLLARAVISKYQVNKIKICYTLAKVHYYYMYFGMHAVSHRVIMYYIAEVGTR